MYLAQNGTVWGYRAVKESAWVLENCTFVSKLRIRLFFLCAIHTSDWICLYFISVLVFHAVRVLCRSRFNAGFSEEKPNNRHVQAKQGTTRPSMGKTSEHVSSHLIGAVGYHWRKCSICLCAIQRSSFDRRPIQGHSVFRYGQKKAANIPSKS